MQTRREAGFSLIEVVIVVAVIGIVSAIALPDLLAWSRGLKYKEAARTLASDLRSTRAQAVAENREYRLMVDVSGDGKVVIGGVSVTMQPYQYAIQRGSLASNTTNYGVWTTVTEDNGGKVGRSLISKQGPTKQLLLKGNTNCVGTADVIYQFNPNGTSDTGYICVMDSDQPSLRRWLVGIPSAASGRVLVSR